MMAGAMIVMGACVFGGLTAVVLMAIGQRTPAAIVGGIAGVVILIGIVVQLQAGQKLKAASQAAAQKGPPK